MKSINVQILSITLFIILLPPIPLTTHIAPLYHILPTDVNLTHTLHIVDICLQLRSCVCNFHL